MKIKLVVTDNDLKRILNYDYGVFSDSLDIDWTISALKQAHQDGWQIYVAETSPEEEIVATILVKIEKEAILTKNTPIKIAHRGNGYSHHIKDFFLDLARKHGVSKIYHYCREDDFRSISLNESSGHKRSGRKWGDKVVFEEWVKII